MKIYMMDNLCTIYKLQFNKIQQFLIKNKQEIVVKPECADLIIVGACAAFDADEDRAINIINNLKRYDKPVYVYGCLSKVNPKKFVSDYKFSSWESKELCEKICYDNEIQWNDVILPTEFRQKEDYRVYNPKKKFVGITTGCCFKCTYCPHKLGAGELVSRKEEEILNQIKMLNNENINTIVLTGIDTASYGRDIGLNFAQLLNKILKVLRKDIDIHIAQFNPEGLLDDFELLLECCKDNRVKDMQLPIQTSSYRLLKIMKRNYSLELISDFIVNVRSKNKNIIFRTDLMIGFPSETFIEMEESVDYVIKYFDEIAVYGFETKESTEIANYNLKFYDNTEIEKRRVYAINKIKESRLLVHSGGQLYSTLIESDELKELKRSDNK